MQKILLQLSGVCNWLIFLELLFASWSLFGLFSTIDSHTIEWGAWITFAFYGTLLYFIVTLKNRVVVFRDFDDADLKNVDPTIIIPGKFGILLMVMFGIHILGALVLIAGQGLRSVLNIFEFHNAKDFLFIVLFFLIPLPLVIKGIKLIILIIKLKRFKPSLARTGNA
jgi:hypothetical protein